MDRRVSKVRSGAAGNFAFLVRFRSLAAKVSTSIFDLRFSIFGFSVYMFSTNAFAYSEHLMGFTSPGITLAKS